MNSSSFFLRSYHFCHGSCLCGCHFIFRINTNNFSYFLFICGNIYFLTLKLKFNDMPHTRREIINNQNEFKDEIIRYLKSEFQKSKKDLSKIETVDERILKEKEKLVMTTNKVKI